MTEHDVLVTGTIKMMHRLLAVADAFPWMAAGQSNRATRQAVGSSKTEVEQLAVASGSDRSGGANEGAGSVDIPHVPFSQLKQHRASGSCSGKELLRGGPGCKNHTHGQPHQ